MGHGSGLTVIPILNHEPLITTTIRDPLSFYGTSLTGVPFFLFPLVLAFVLLHQFKQLLKHWYPFRFQ